MEDEVQQPNNLDVSSFVSESSGSTTTTIDAGKILSNADKSGDSIDAVERRMSTIPTNIKTFDIYDDQQYVTPLLKDYISSHPIKQKAVERNIPQYTYTERTLGKLGSLWGKTTKSMEQSKLALSIADYTQGDGFAGKLIPDLYKIKDDFDLAEKTRQYEDAGTELKDLTKYDTGEDDVTDTALGLAGLLIQLGTAPKRAPKVAATAAIGAGVGTATTGVGVVASLPAAGIAAITAGSIEDNLVSTAGSIYQEAYLDNPRKAFIDPQSAYYISLAGGALSSGVEYLQVGKILKNIPGANSLTRKGIIEALKTGKGAAMLTTAKVVGEALKSAMEEYGQNIIQDVSTSVATGKNEFKSVGERILIAAGESATSKESIQSAVIGAFAPVTVGGTVKGATSLGKTAYGHFVDVNEGLGEVGAVDGGGEQPPSDGKPKKEFRFVIQDTEVRKAKQAEKTAKFISDVAETKYNESNSDAIETIEKSISPEGYGYVHVADMEALTAQDEKLLKKWTTFTGQIGEGTKVIRIANSDIVALQRINKEVANIYRSTPDATSVKSHNLWLEKLDSNKELVQNLMTEMQVQQKDVSQMFEGDVQYKDQLNDAVRKAEENALPENLEIDPTAKQELKIKYDILSDQLDKAVVNQDEKAIEVAANNLIDHTLTDEPNTLQKEKSQTVVSQLKKLGLTFTKNAIDAIKSNAKTAIGETKINQMDPRMFVQNAREYAREANVALSRGDYDAYYEAKRLQLTNLQMVKEAQNVKTNLSTLLTTIQTVSSYDVQQQMSVLNNKSVDFINDLISILNVDPRTGRIRLDNEEYATFVKDLKDRNVALPTLTDDMFVSTGVELKSLTVNQIDAINKALNSAVQATKTELKLFNETKEKNLSSIAERIFRLVGTRADGDPKNYERYQSILEEQDLKTLKSVLAKNSIGVIKSSINALIGNLADITRNDLDLGENNGFFTQLFYNPLIESANEKVRLQNSFNQVLAEFVKSYGTKEWIRLERTKVQFFGRTISKAELIVMTSYLGTESSRRRLTKWLGQNINDITLELEKTVSYKDVVKMQNIVNFYEKVVLPKETQLNQKMGLPPLNEIPALPFKFDGKEFKGGYVPLNTIMDKFSKAHREGTSYAEDMRAGKISIDNMTHNQAFSVHELNREDSDLPLDLTVTGLRRTFDMRAHMVAYQESAYNINRILTHPKTIKALVNVLGADKFLTLHDTIQTVVGNRYNSETDSELKAKILTDFILQNATFAALGGNVVTVLKQPASFPLMFKNLASSGNPISAAKHLTAAIVNVITNPVTFYQQSEFIAKYDASFAEKFKQWNKNNPDWLRLSKSMDPTLDQIEDHRKWWVTRGWQSFRTVSLNPLSYVSLALNTIQWTAAYNMAMDGAVQNVKPNLKDAALHATKMVRFSLERNEVFESSAIQRSWYLKPFTFMTNQLSVIGASAFGQFNIAQRKSKINSGTMGYEYSKAFAIGFMTVGLPAMMIKLLFGKATEDEEGNVTEEYEKLLENPKSWFGKNAMWSLADSLPIVSSVSYMAQGNLDYGNPVSDFLTGTAALFKVVYATAKGDEPTREEKYKARKFLTGTLTGIPYRKIQDKIYEYLFSEPDSEAIALYDNGQSGIQSDEKPDTLAYQTAQTTLGMLWAGGSQFMDKVQETAKSIVSEMKESAESLDQAKIAHNAEKLTSPRGYLMNSEFRQVTIRYGDGTKTTISLTEEQDKDLEVYIDTIGRKETSNYKSLVNPYSSARGYVQLVNSTKKLLVENYPEYAIYKDTPVMELPKEIQFDMARKLNMELYNRIKELNIESKDTRYSLWYITAHVLGNGPASEALLNAYKEGKMTKKINKIIGSNIITNYDGTAINLAVFGRAKDDLTLAEMLDRVENGYDNVSGIADYRKLSEKDYDDGIGAIK